MSKQNFLENQMTNQIVLFYCARILADNKPVDGNYLHGPRANL